MMTQSLGRTELQVTTLGFGAMELRGPSSWRGRELEPRQAESILNEVLDAGINFIDSLKFIENHEPTHSVVILGEIGGEEEEKLSDYIIKTNFSKPVVGFIGGSSAPPEKQMGHAGAIISEGSGTYESKIKALKTAGAKIAIRPIEIPQILNKIV